ncbi:hypothetical protein Tco_0437891 [Tanacetum coccineum]
MLRLTKALCSKFRTYVNVHIVEKVNWADKVPPNSSSMDEDEKRTIVRMVVFLCPPFSEDEDIGICFKELHLYLLQDKLDSDAFSCSMASLFHVVLKLASSFANLELLSIISEASLTLGLELRRQIGTTITCSSHSESESS